MMKGAGLTRATTALLLVSLSPYVQANRNFVADWTFRGSSISNFRALGDADWRAENGEIIGVPRSPAGGWLILDRPMQDTQFAATFRCTGNCRTGVMLRTETTAAGIHGAYVALPEGDNPAAAFALKLDSQGHELSREKLKPAGGMTRVMVQQPPRNIPPPQPGQAAPPRRAPGNSLPPESPYKQPDYTYHAGEWTPLEVILDANIMRVWMHDGPESGSTSGEADDDVASYGPVALYVGGTGEVHF